MKLVNIFIILTIFGTAAAFSLSMSSQQQSSSNQVDRQSFVRTVAVGAAGGLMANGGLFTVRPAVADDDEGFVTTESGLKYKILKEGTGGIPTPGQTVKVSNLYYYIYYIFLYYNLIITFRLSHLIPFSASSF
jgi:hypothetical protein